MTDRTLLSVEHDALVTPMPRGACDTHVHVFGPPGRYRFAANRTFMPSPVTVEELMQFQRILGVDRAVVVQASPQGTDTTCLTDTLATLADHGREARGVAVVEDDIGQAALRDLHAAGVRGLRVNLQSFGISSPQTAIDRLSATARVAERMGWHVQIYAGLGVIEALAPSIASLPVPIVIDHFGLAHARFGVQQPGFATLLDLVAAGNTYVKLSAPYRIVERRQGEDGAPIARALIAANPERMLWGTDWPHTNPPPGYPRSVDTPERLQPVDDGHQCNIFFTWTSPQERQRILVDNPAQLYDFAPIAAAT